MAEAIYFEALLRIQSFIAKITVYSLADGTFLHYVSGSLHLVILYVLKSTLFDINIKVFLYFSTNIYKVYYFFFFFYFQPAYVMFKIKLL